MVLVHIKGHLHSGHPGFLARSSRQSQGSHPDIVVTMEKLHSIFERPSVFTPEVFQTMWSVSFPPQFKVDLRVQLGAAGMERPHWLKGPQ